MTWKKARKKPIIIEFREVKGLREVIRTREGTLFAVRDTDYVIKGIKGEIYPINKEIFNATYEVLDE